MSIHKKFLLLDYKKDNTIAPIFEELMSKKGNERQSMHKDAYRPENVKNKQLYRPRLPSFDVICRREVRHEGQYYSLS